MLKHCVILLILWSSILGSTSAQITWRRTYGGFGSNEATCVRQVSDGGYIIAGSTGSFGGGSGDIYVIRVDELGDPIWSRVYGGQATETGASIRELTDGFIIAGTTSMGDSGSYDMMLVRTDLLGQVLWQKDYGTSDWDLCNALEVLPDGFIFGGISYGSGSPVGSVSITRTDLDGNIVWTSSPATSLRSECAGIASLSGDGFVIAGRIADMNGSEDALLMKMDINGIVDWTFTYGGAGDDQLYSVLETGTGDIVAAGGSRSQSPTKQIYLMKCDASGQLIWEQYIGSMADAAASEVRNDHSSGYVLTGYNTLNLGERDMILTTTDNDGWFQFGNNYGDGEPADGYSIDPTDDGGYVVAGWSENYGSGPRSVYVVKTDSMGLTATLDVTDHLDPLPTQDLNSIASSVSILFPNPLIQGSQLEFVNDQVSKGTLTVFDAIGRTILTTAYSPGIPLTWSTQLRPGTYAVDLRSEGKYFRQVLVVQ